MSLTVPVTSVATNNPNLDNKSPSINTNAGLTGQKLNNILGNIAFPGTGSVSSATSLLHTAYVDAGLSDADADAAAASAAADLKTLMNSPGEAAGLASVEGDLIKLGDSAAQSESDAQKIASYKNTANGAT